MTPIKQIVRRGRLVFGEDWNGNLEQQAECPTVLHAIWVASSLARAHGVPCVAREPEDAV